MHWISQKLRDGLHFDKMILGRMITFVFATLTAAYSVVVARMEEDELRVMAVPWKWPLTRAPSGAWDILGFPFLWILVVSGGIVAALVPISLVSFKISTDRTAEAFGPRGGRSLRRKEKREFMAFLGVILPFRRVMSSTTLVMTMTVEGAQVLSESGTQ